VFPSSNPSDCRDLLMLVGQMAFVLDLLLSGQEVSAIYGPLLKLRALCRTTCHMPKIELPSAHFKFSDHPIRLVKVNEPLRPRKSARVMP